MNDNQVFSIFDIEISKPFEIETVSKVLEKQMEYKDKLENEKYYPEEYAFKEIEKIYTEFFAQMSEQDKKEFEELHALAIEISIKKGIQNNEKEKTKSLELYGIPVEYPFIRQNIRDIVAKEKQLKQDLIRSGLTEQQADLNIQDLIIDFYMQAGLGKQEEFSFIYTQEKIAEISNETQEEMKSEIKKINNYYLIYSVIGLLLILFVGYVFLSTLNKFI